MIHLGYSIFHYKGVIFYFLHSLIEKKTFSYMLLSELTFLCFND